jgi:hypothetical protein
MKTDVTPLRAAELSRSERLREEYEKRYAKTVAALGGSWNAAKL